MNCFGVKTSRALVLGAVIALFSLLSSARKEAATLSGATIRQLEKDIPELMKKHGVPGLSIALIRGGKTTWVHGFGIKEARTGQPVMENTVFEAASLSKPVFTYGVLKLVDRGSWGWTLR